MPAAEVKSAGTERPPQKTRRRAPHSRTQVLMTARAALFFLRNEKRKRASQEPPDKHDAGVPLPGAPHEAELRKHTGARPATALASRPRSQHVTYVLLHVHSDSRTPSAPEFGASDEASARLAAETSPSGALRSTRLSRQKRQLRSVTECSPTWGRRA
ncbi:hypothetical protein BESB_084780 [Besnoitia besnoiti]|uniref:Uncharacterized protein n=1 Tax=Besnoitia besnoiti TaxID=94643 RepID=A0A2A9M5R1_BESBE|nr:hypothetical protein BESB_084780 [Besnoitia besnoiti]PFH33279.1 hypothetical protein BESB_084780 [Besnoitia besnoiti]